MSNDPPTHLAPVLRCQGLLGAGLLVALSGGLDSVCLLHLLAELRDRWGGRLEVAHVDHALRPESGADATFCRNLAGELGCPFHLRRLGPGTWGGRGGLQAAGRRARRGFFDEVLARRGLAAVALGHHADDQVETVLFRLARGAGLRGVAGMEEFDPPYLRPLLGWSRAELAALARDRGWPHREDASNRGAAYARNRLRHQVLPLLEGVHPGAAAGVLRFARLAADDDRVLTRLAREARDRLCVAEPDGVRLPVAGLRALEGPVRRRLYLALWEGGGWPAERLHNRHLEAVDALLSQGRSQRVASVPGPGRFVRSYDQLWVLPPAVEAAGVEARLTAPDGAGLPTPAGMLRWGTSRPGHCEAVAVPASGGGPLWVRSRRDGDRLYRPGHRPRKLKELLIAARVPRWRRSAVLLVGVGAEAFAALGPGCSWGGGDATRGWLWLDPRPADAAG